MAIDKAKVKAPKIPVLNALQEAENLFHWATDDKQMLVAKGLEIIFLDELPIRAGTCREAESLWVKERNTTHDTKKEWEKVYHEAEKLRKEILDAFDFAFRKDEELLKKVSYIRKGDSHTDLIQDLSDMAVLGKANKPLMEKINFDMALFDKADNTASSMARLLAIINGERQQDNPIKIIRDKAYTHLKEAVDEVRACGKYVFANNKDRLKGYISNYFKTRKKRSKDNKNG